MKKKYSILLVAAILLLVLTSLQVFASVGQDKGKEVWEREPLEIKVVLQTKYLDGNIVEEVKKETIWSLQDFWAGYQGWKVMKQEKGKVVFRKNINDLSPAVKQNGYFGINENNVLSIFNGKPVNNDVIKAFYEIDVGKLESKRINKLKAGIKIEKKSTFEEVIKTYKQYASSQPVSE